MRMRWTIPLWLATALLYAAVLEFLILLARADWAGVLWVIIFGVFVAVYVRRYYKTNVLERSPGRVVIETMKIRGKGAAPTPTPAPSETLTSQPATVEQPREPEPEPEQPRQSEPAPTPPAQLPVSASDAPLRPQRPFPAPPTAPTPTTTDSRAVERLRQLEELRAASLVSDAEYHEKRREILDRV